MADLSSLYIACSGSQWTDQLENILNALSLTWTYQPLEQWLTAEVGQPHILLGCFTMAEFESAWQRWRTHEPQAWALAVIAPENKEQALHWQTQGLVDDWLCCDTLSTLELQRALGVFCATTRHTLHARRMQAITHVMLDMVAEFTLDGVYLYSSSSHYDALGYEPQELTGRSVYELVHPEDLTIVEEGLKTLQSQERVGPVECRYLHKQGYYVWLSCQAVRMRTPEREVVMVGAREITHLKEIENRLQRSLQERGQLLQEVYHRVKNNLQVISSMLNLQVRRTQDPMAAQILRETQNRILSMALAHEKLYESEDLERIDMAQYARELSNYLFHAFGLGLSAIQLEYECEPVYLNIDQAISCGLILNELISNAMRYAFPQLQRRTSCRIHVRVCMIADDRVELAVMDNGVGLPAHVDPLNPQTLGLRLVNSLSRQLGGSVHTESKGGFQIYIRFPKKGHSG